MKNFNLNQRRIIAEILVNLLTAGISIMILTTIFLERRFDFLSLLSALLTFFICLLFAFLSIIILK